MWHILALVVSLFIDAVVVAVFPASGSTVAASLAAQPVPLVNVLSSAITVFGLFIDWPVFFGCLSFVLGWRLLLWLPLRIWRLLLTFIPALG